MVMTETMRSGLGWIEFWCRLFYFPVLANHIDRLTENEGYQTAQKRKAVQLADLKGFIDVCTGKQTKP